MFKSARPVWLSGKEKEMNITGVFTQSVGTLEGARLYIAAASFYRLYINGKFVAFGPARAAKGYARVDILPLSEYNSGGDNMLRIEVAAYNCKSLSTCISEGFLCAELRQGDNVIACTGRDFEGGLLESKLQYVERYSVQRHFGEIWDMTKGIIPHPVTLIESAPKFLPRVATYPLYRDAFATEACVRGSFEDSGAEPKRCNCYSWQNVPEHWGIFAEERISLKPYAWIMSQRQIPTEKKLPLPLTVSAGEYVMLDLSRLECGFLQLDVSSTGGADIVIGFSEYCGGEEFEFSNINCQNVIECILPAGFCDMWQSFEPYTLRFGIVIVKSGSIKLGSFGVKTFEHDMRNARVEHFETAAQENIYKAAMRTFAHNAVDLYSDCPSRERAGWLCDSYFTAVAEYHFFGSVPTEDAFLENHRLCRDPLLPKGMLAMCYPSDMIIEPDGGGQHIPQWCMWYVLEVKEYLKERNTAVDPEIYRESVEGIVNYLEQFANSDGLLEDIPSWNFVEWSRANDWTKNVNYPTNFLYAGVLLAAYELYGNEEWRLRAEHIQKKAAELSFDGELFTDNAVRAADGVLRNTGNTSEAGQYYAVIFGNIDIEAPRYAKFKSHIFSGCEGVAESGRTFTPVNAFIGLYLRLKALLGLKLYDTLLKEVEYFFGEMADKTETLWEYRGEIGSYDHGFASYAAYAMCVALEKLREKRK